MSLESSRAIGTTTSTTHAQFEWSPPTTKSPADELVQKDGNLRCRVYVFADFAPADENPSGYSSSADVIARHSEIPSRRLAIERARQWLANEVQSEIPNSVKFLRLKKGWSQHQLAEEIGTSQSHIARIERGTEQIRLDTFKRLCAALSVEMKDLSEAMDVQERLAQRKEK